jgi:hypothetical protein
MEREATLDMPSKKGCRVRQSFVKPPTQLGLAISHASSMLLPDWEKAPANNLSLIALQQQQTIQREEIMVLRPQICVPRERSKANKNYFKNSLEKNSWRQQLLKWTIEMQHDFSQL